MNEAGLRLLSLRDAVSDARRFIGKDVKGKSHLCVSAAGSGRGSAEIGDDGRRIRTDGEVQRSDDTRSCITVERVKQHTDAGITLGHINVRQRERSGCGQVRRQRVLQRGNVGEQSRCAVLVGVNGP